jgi:hypothetical protein
LNKRKQIRKVCTGGLEAVSFGTKWQKNGLIFLVLQHVYFLSTSGIWGKDWEMNNLLDEQGIEKNLYLPSNFFFSAYALR